jgi:hypothetical protein
LHETWNFHSTEALAHAPTQHSESDQIQNRTFGETQARHRIFSLANFAIIGSSDDGICVGSTQDIPVHKMEPP